MLRKRYIQYIFHMKKVLPRTYRVYGNGTSSTMSYSYEKGTPPGHRVHGNGTPSTYYPEHRHTKPRKGHELFARERDHFARERDLFARECDLFAFPRHNRTHVLSGAPCIHKTQYTVHRTQNLMQPFSDT